MMLTSLLASLLLHFLRLYVVLSLLGMVVVCDGTIRICVLRGHQLALRSVLIGWCCDNWISRLTASFCVTDTRASAHQVQDAPWLVLIGCCRDNWIRGLMVGFF